MGISVDLSSTVFCGIQLRAISHKILMILICDIRLEITFLKLLPHLAGANELSSCSPTDSDENVVLPYMYGNCHIRYSSHVIGAVIYLILVAIPVG